MILDIKIKLAIFVGLIIFISITSSNIFAEPTAAKCSKVEIEKLRSGSFKTLYQAQKYEEAAKVLESYIEDHKCFKEIVYPAFNASENGDETALPDVESIMWARSDIALAYLKANKLNNCLSIAKGHLYEFYQNPLELVDSEKLRTAFETNEKACNAKRSEMYPSRKLSNCDLKLDGQIVSKIVPIDAENGAKVDLKVSKVLNSFKLEDNADECVALVEVKVPRGLYMGLCNSIQECEASKEQSDRAPIDIQTLVAAKENSDQKIEIQSIEVKGIEDLCGELALSPHQDKSNSTIFELAGGLSPCGGGTARLEIDTYFKISLGKYQEVDPLLLAYH